MRASLALQRAALVLALALFLAPVLWLVTTAYKPGREVFSAPPGVLFTPTLDNFRAMLRLFDVGALLRNSLVISLGSAAAALLLGVPAGYALARARWRGAIGLAYLFLAVRTVPPVATLIPFYLLMRDLHLLGTWWAVIALNTTLNAAFVTWMMFASFRALPREVEEAALTDGCTLGGAFLRAALPSVLPGLIASALFCILFSWNDFLYAMVLTRPDTEPVSVALLSAYGTKDISWGVLGAMAHVSTLPIVLIALTLNRYFVAGLTRGVH